VITLPDGSVKEAEKGVSLYDFAGSIGRGLRDASLAAVVDGEKCDLSDSLKRSCAVSFLTFDQEGGRDVFWHSSAHLLAQAVSNLYPGTKYTIGPSIDTGFYYDFDCPEVLSSEHLLKIEAEMARIVKENIPVTRKVISREEAVALFEEKGNEYKMEILKELPEGEVISIYSQGEFVDLCRGPHVISTGKLKAFKLTGLAGAYWRGDVNNKMLQRVYGVSFPEKRLLKEHFKRLEEAKKRDHRKIGKELDLFSFHEEGPGFPFWHPNGTVLYNNFMRYIREQNVRHGYEEIMTPVILNDDLWYKSGHRDNFKEHMYFTDIDEKSYAVKPMNCPGALLIYKTGFHSYRELPIRNAEMGLVHRHELSGVLHGLFRVRSFTQDDAHIFCAPEQLQEEVRRIIEYTVAVYRDFGYEDISVFIATRPGKSIGSDEVWETATSGLKDALTATTMEYRLKEGEGAFYGPKIEFNIEDCLGRNWQCGTIQVDFSMPERFGAIYHGSDGKEHTPVMIHRAVFGSLERFIGITIEHFAGKFPFWLAPVQAAVLSISEKIEAYASWVAEKLQASGFRVATMFSSESLGNKIRVARNKRVPYILIIGEQEQENRTVSFKTFNNDNGSGVAIDRFIEGLVSLRAERGTALLVDFQGVDRLVHG